MSSPPDREPDPGAAESAVAETQPHGSGSTAEPPGTDVLDRYALVERIGSGGAGTVWRGRDTLLERDIAMKQVHVPEELPEHERTEIRQKVLREARAAARIEHPNVVRLHDVVEEDGLPYLVMELVDAPSLEEMVEERTLDPGEAAAIGLAILEGLEAAHAHGIVHRDVKPSNVLVPADGPPMLTDFGIATVADRPSATTTGVIRGSPAYMAPEQASDQRVGPPADLWALGATLYYAVEGLPPFSERDPVRTLRSVMEQDPRPAERAGGLAPLLRSILVKDPSARPTVDELRNELVAVRDGGRGTSTDSDTTTMAPAGADDTSTGGATAPPRTGLLVGGAVLVLLLIATAVVLLAGGGRIPAPDIPIAENGEEADAPPDTEGVPVAAVPEGWETHEPAGEPYVIQHPGGWELREQAGNRTDIVDPATGAYVRIDWTDDPHPDPVADREEFAPQFAAQQQAYDEIRLERATFRGLDAAVWEFTYVDGDVELHAVQLNISGATNGYAVHYQDAAGSFDEETFGAFVTSFEPQE